MSDEPRKPPSPSTPAGQSARQAPPNPKVQALVAALRDPDVNRIYANGFTLGLSNADVHIIWQMFGRPVAMVNFSYTLAKTLSIELEKLVRDWEAATKQTLQTTQMIDKAFEAEK